MTSVYYRHDCHAWFFDNDPERRPETEGGFTLIELMIVVAIVAVLTMIAYPSYQNYIVRANRSQAQQFLMDIAQREEQFRLDQGQYATDLGDLRMTRPATVANYYDTPSFYTTGARPFFVVALTPLGSTMQKDDGRVFINSRGEHWRDTDNTCALAACVYSSASASLW